MSGSQVLTPVFRVARFFALVAPPYAEGFKLKAHKVYAVVVVLLIIAGYAVSLYGKIVEAYPTQTFTVAIIDALTYTVLVLSIVVEIIRSSILNVDKFKDVLVTVSKIDKCLESNNLKPHRHFYVEIVLGHCLMVLLLGYDCYIWTNTVGWHIYFKYILKDICEYANLIMVLLIYNYCVHIKIRFTKLNECLERCHAQVEQDKPPSTASQIKVNNYVSSKETWEMVKEIRTLYGELSSLVALFNYLFGWHIFFLCAIILMGVLEVVNFGLVIALVANGRFIGDTELEFDFITLIFLWCLALSIMGVVVAVTCDMTTKEAQRTATVCYNLLLDVPAASNNVQDRILREELILLAQQATHQCPYFSAAGFFNVDYTMLFGLLGTVTSYIIVLIQINK